MSERRWALLIAIDAYQYLPPEVQLHGCVNDQEVWRELLTSPSAGFAFPASGITQLTNADATHDGILAGLDELAEKAGPDDVVFVQYSGHGSQVQSSVPNSSGDGLSSTIVPSDARNPAAVAARLDITDLEIHQKLLALIAKTPRVTLVFDSCHSGTITRDLFSAPVRQIEPDLRPPSDFAAAPPTTTPTTPTPGAFGFSGGYTVLAACRDEQSAHEYDPGVDHGALTWFLTRALSTARPGATYRDVFEEAAAGVSGQYVGQTPQIDGQVDRTIFGLSDFTPMRFLPVASRAGQTATIGGGAAQTVDVGSRWAVYPAGTHEATDAKPLGTLVVTAADATTATANVESETAEGAIAPPARAVRDGQQLGDAASALALRVAMAADGSPLAGLVKASPVLELVAPDDPTAYARVYTIAPRTAAAASDPVPQLGPLTAATIAVVGPDGLLLVPDRAAALSDTPQQICADLETFGRYKRVLDLENPGSPLNGVVDVQLLRPGAGDTWVVAEPDPVEGKVVFDVDDWLGVRLTSNHTAPLYPAVLDLGLTYAIGMLPGCTGADVLMPGHTVDFYEFNGQHLIVEIPSAYPFAPGPSGVPDSGVETLKLFLTIEPTDFSFLEQEGVTRDIGLSSAAPGAGSDWATGIRQFVVRRAAPAVALDGGSAGVEVGGTTISTVGVTAGTVTSGPGGEANFGLASSLNGVLGSAGLVVQTTVQMKDVAGTRDLGPTMDVTPPAPGPGQGQMLLVRDEAGVLSWNFASATRDLDDAGPRTYRLDRGVVVEPPEDPGTRGLVSAVGTKLLNVVAFPLIDPVAGAVSDYFAGRWEAKYRPNRIRWSTPDDFSVPGGADVQAADWGKLGGKRSLLLVHGLFSRSSSCFAALPKDVFTALYQQYEGRVIALDHFTLSATPRQNVDWFLSQIPDGTELQLDVLSHSRGGLVARSLVEHQSEFSLGSRKLAAGRVVMVASPNDGTVMASGAQLGALINVITNILNCFPENGVTDILAVVVTVAKMIAVGSVNGLDGLASMVPGSDFLAWLNAGPAPEGVSYYALAAAHAAQNARIAAFAEDAVIDHVFSKQQNDLVVPTSGVFGQNGAGLFPIGGDGRYVFEPAAGVTHTTFFSNATTQEKLKEWLLAG